MNKEVGSEDEPGGADFRVRGLNSEQVERLRMAVAAGGGNQEVARKSRIPLSTLNSALAGLSDIRSSGLAAVARATGHSLDWIMFGEEAGRPASDAVSSVDAGEVVIDREIFGRVVDAIQRLYKDEHVGLSGVDLGRIAAEKYEEIAAATGDPGERLAMVKLMVVQLRKDLTEAATAPGSGKRSAS